MKSSYILKKIRNNTKQVKFCFEHFVIFFIIVYTGDMHINKRFDENLNYQF